MAESDGPPEGNPDPRAVVRDGWNRLSTIHRPEGAPLDAFGHDEAEYAQWLEPLLHGVPEGARVLDLGCGPGVPADRMLAERFHVTGVDISDVQIARARRTLPQGEFLRADMTEVEFPPGRFGAAIALYSLIHVPLEDQPPLLSRVHGWLVDGGLFLLITGHTAWTGYEETWLGSPGAMFWSHADADTYERWLVRAGFELRHRRYVPEGETGHELFLVQKPGSERPRA